MSALLTIARGRRALRDPASAVALLEEAAALAREHERRGQLQAVLSELAQVVAEQGDLRRAVALPQEALAVGRVRPPVGRRSIGSANAGRRQS